MTLRQHTGSGHSIVNGSDLWHIRATIANLATLLDPQNNGPSHRIHWSFDEEASMRRTMALLTDRFNEEAGKR